jgi:hypothetical protein
MSRSTLARRALGVAFAASLALTAGACSDDDGDGQIIDDDTQEDINDTGDEVEDGVDDAGDEIEEQIDEGAEEGDEGE